MDPRLHLLRDGELRKHVVQSPIDELIGPSVTDAVQRLLPGSVRREWLDDIESRLQTFRPKIRVSDFERGAISDFIDEVWPSVRVLMDRYAEVPTPRLLASVRESLVPLGYDDLAPTVWPRAVNSHVRIPSPGMSWDGSRWCLNAGDAVAATLGGDGAMRFDHGVDLGTVRVASLESGLSMGPVAVDWNGGGVTIGLDGTDLVTLSPEAMVTRGSVATGSSLYVGETIAMHPSRLENVVESAGSISFRVTKPASQVRSLLIDSDGRVVINPGVDDTSAPSDMTALRVNGGVATDVAIVDRVQADTVVCNKLVVGSMPPDSDIVSLSGRHARMVVAAGAGSRIVTFPNPFGSSAIVHATFLGTGSVDVVRVGQRSIDVMVATPAGGEVMVSAFPNSNMVI